MPSCQFLGIPNWVMISLHRFLSIFTHYDLGWFTFIPSICLCASWGCGMWVLCLTGTHSWLFLWLTDLFILLEKSLKWLPANDFRLEVFHFSNSSICFPICGMWEPTPPKQQMLGRTSSRPPHSPKAPKPFTSTRQDEPSKLQKAALPATDSTAANDP